MPVSALSGGERNRLLLARLFAQPANLLVLDEPTNDLDLETLELLEDILVRYRGTLLVVSHDRAFLDNVVTSTLVFEGEGRVVEYVGGWTDAERQRRAARAKTLARTPAASKASGAAASHSEPVLKSVRLAFREQRELESLPALIESLEAEQARLGQEISEPDFYRSDAAAQARVQARLGEVSRSLESAYQRWTELEARRDAR
jgi:ATP-binding cassette subfamily F protein uup